MVKTPQQLLQAGKDRRKKYATANATLKNKKNWYPVTDGTKKFTKRVRKTTSAALRKDIVPGQVLILLSGRFRGRRVVFLKQLPSGLLLVTGPYKVNGVPLKRVNQAYVIPTQTKLTLKNVPGVDKINDDLFLKRVNIDRSKGFFDTDAVKKTRVTKERSDLQNQVDTEVLKTVKSVESLRDYLKNRFALKSGDKPHLMKF